MKTNRLKQALAEGRIPVGHMIWEFGTRGIAKILESADLDFVLVDMEHSSFELERVADLMAWFKATPVTPFVRVPQPDYHFLARVMDAGAMGVMIGNVETPETARRIVDAVKFAPMGKRGVGLGAAHTDYVVPDPVTYFTEINRNSTVICQIESPLGVENCERIAVIPGVDLLWVGHFDLSQAMGIPAQFQHPQFLDALKRVSKACHDNGKHAGIQPATLEQSGQWAELGYDVLSWGADSAVYRAALVAGVNALRAQIAARTKA
ncbi:MAG: aldolase/citrate lyase family protein [Acidobacteriota bacterium]|nr:aldolase/citrate lyase family protein [Acidobacteriota bacterium]